MIPKFEPEKAVEPSTTTRRTAQLPAHRLAVLQSTVGNRAVGRMVSRTPARPTIQRGLWGSDRPPNLPKATPDLTQRIATLTREDYTAFQLRTAWAKGGKEAAAALAAAFVKEVEAAGPASQGQVRAAMDKELAKIGDEETKAVVEFSATANASITNMLDLSTKALNDEMVRYGFGNDAKGDPKFTATKDMANMAKAAKELVEADAAVANLQISLAQKFKRERGPMEAQQDREITDKAVHSDASFIAAVQKYEQLYDKHLATYPILAAYRNKPFEMNALSQAAKSPAAAGIARAELDKKRANIASTKQNLASGKLSIYGLPSVMAVAKMQMAATPGSLKERFVDDKAKAVASDKSNVDMALAAISIAALVVATVATAGGALVVAGAATGVGVGISAAKTLESVEQYGVAASAANTDLDRARSIAQTDPSLFWLALDIAMFVTDIVQAGTLFKAAAGPVRKLASMRTAIAGGGAGAEDAAKLTKVFEEELKPALRGLPQPAADRVLATMDPAKALPDIAKAAGSGKWMFGAVRHLLDKTASGRRVLSLIDKYGLTVAYDAKGMTRYEPSLKTIFVAEKSSTDDAMNAIVHEVEHADWHLTGKSASNRITTITREAYIQGMCSEEAAAEAATIRNKFSLQTLLDRKVMAAPTEQIYRDAYIAQAQALRPSNMAEAEKIALSSKKAENALFAAFHDGTIPNGIDRTTYPSYYGRGWDQANGVAAAATPKP